MAFCPDHTGYRVGGGWIEPDVSVSWPDQKRDAKYFLRSPMVAVEVLSPDEDIDPKIELTSGRGHSRFGYLTRDARR